MEKTETFLSRSLPREGGRERTMAPDLIGIIYPSTQSEEKETQSVRRVRKRRHPEMGASIDNGAQRVFHSQTPSHVDSR